LKKEQVLEVVVELTELAVRLGWRQEEIHRASTGSVYIDFTRIQGDQKEWVVIRVATHKQVYHRWMTTYSYSPYEYDELMLQELLAKPFGEVGDVFGIG